MFTLFKQHKKILLIFIVFTFVFYGTSLKNKFALDDEYIAVTNFPVAGQPYTPNHNLVSKGFGGIVKIWQSKYAHDGESNFDYRPFTTTTFAIEYAIFGQNPFMNHFINVLLYAFICCLVYVLILKLFEAYSFKDNLAFVCALLFLIHPAHSEVVNNIKCRDELLALMFALLALWYSILFFDSTKVKYIVYAVLFLALGLFSKKTAILALGIIPLCLFFYRGLSIKKLAITMALLGVAYYTYQYSKSHIVTEKAIRNFYHFENPMFTTHFSFLEKIPVALQTFGFYVKFLIVPFPLRFYYGANMLNVNEPVDVNFIIGIAFFAFAIWYYFKYRNKHFLFSLLLFLGCIFPFSNLLKPVAGIVGERLCFFSSVGFCLMIGIITIKLFENKDLLNTKLLFKKPTIFLTLLTLLCLVYAFNRNKNWYDKFTLFSHDAEYLEKSAKGNSLVANEYFELLRSPQPKSPQLYIQKAILHYSRAVANDSTIYSAYNNLGVVYFNYMGDVTLAKKWFRLAIRHRENYSQAYENLGNCFVREKQLALAEQNYRTAVTINPKQFTAWKAWIQALIENKEYEKGIKIIDEASKHFMDNYELVAQKGNCYLLMGDIKTCLRYFETAYMLNPNHELAAYMAQKYLEIKDTANYNLYKDK